MAARVCSFAVWLPYTAPSTYDPKRPPAWGPPRPCSVRSRLCRASGGRLGGEVNDVPPAPNQHSSWPRTVRCDPPRKGEWPLPPREVRAIRPCGLQRRIEHVDPALDVLREEVVRAAD